MRIIFMDWETRKPIFETDDDSMIPSRHEYVIFENKLYDVCSVFYHYRNIDNIEVVSFKKSFIHDNRVIVDYIAVTIKELEVDVISSEE